MKIIINNNSITVNNPIAVNNHHTYLKSITLTRKEFNQINQRIDQQYWRLKDEKYCFAIFYSWALFATILGIFSGHGDIESTKILFNCITKNYLPEISVIRDNGRIKICIWIRDQELCNEKQNEF